jgi:hypothetical protein
MAKWEIEVIFEPTGDYMNFVYETDNEDEENIFNEIANQISIVPDLVEKNEELKERKVDLEQ